MYEQTFSQIYLQNLLQAIRFTITPQNDLSKANFEK